MLMSSKFSYDPKSIKKIVAVSVTLIIFMTLGNLFEKDRKYEIGNKLEKTKTQDFEDEATNENEVTNEDGENLVEIYEKTEELEEVLAKTIFVDITGEVKAPTVIELGCEERLESAIKKAGGLTLDADRNAVNMAQKLVDGAQYIIPAKGKILIINYPELQGSLTDETSTEKEDERVNINTASKDRLEELPGVGDVLSQRIIDYRNENGEFKSIEGLLEVSGIGDKKFEDMKNYVCI